MWKGSIVVLLSRTGCLPEIILKVVEQLKGRLNVKNTGPTIRNEQKGKDT